MAGCSKAVWRVTFALAGVRVTATGHTQHLQGQNNLE